MNTPDYIDHASEIEALFLRAALSARRPVGPDAEGECHNCAAPVPAGARFCDQDCRDDWQHRKAARARNGVAQ